jgi:hypothetical protein
MVERGGDGGVQRRRDEEGLERRMAAGTGFGDEELGF